MGRKKSKPKKKVLTFKQKLAKWFEGGEISDHEGEIKAFISDEANSFTDTDHNDTSVVFWAAKGNYHAILGEAFNWQESEDYLDVVHDITCDDFHESCTALSMSAYFGYHQCVQLLVNAGAKFIVEGVPDIYYLLGRGYLKRPTDAEGYKKAFKYLVSKDSDKPNRKAFSDKYASTSYRAYLACLRLYDQVSSGKKDRNNWPYKQRDLLSVESDAVRRFFRFDGSLRAGGVAEVLSGLLFPYGGGASVPVDLSGYSARSVVIALVNEMCATDKAEVHNAVSSSHNMFVDNRKIFSANFKLGEARILYEWRPSKWQGGNCVIKVNNQMPESYGPSMAIHLERLTNTDGGNANKTSARTKKLGSLLLQKTKQLEPFRHHEFTYSATATYKVKIRTCRDGKDGKAVATPQQAKNKINMLNGLLVLWSIAEPARRLSGHKAKTSSSPPWKRRFAINLDRIPVATMQIRALQLLAEGAVGVQDVFGRSAKYASAPYNNHGHKAQYGVSTGNDLVENFRVAKEKAKHLGELELPLPALVRSSSFFSRNYTKEFLKEGYGSAGESDDSDYSDDDYKLAFI